MTFYESSWCYDVPLKSGGEEGSGVGKEELRSGEGVVRSRRSVRRGVVNRVVRRCGEEAR
jgi:hypothetical protein